MKRLNILLGIILAVLILIVTFAALPAFSTVEAQTEPTNHFINMNIFADERGYIDRFVDCDNQVVCYRTQDDISCVKMNYVPCEIEP